MSQARPSKPSKDSLATELASEIRAAHNNETLSALMSNAFDSIDQYTLVLVSIAGALAIIGVRAFPDLRSQQPWGCVISAIGLPAVGFLAVQHGSGVVLGGFILWAALAALITNSPTIWGGSAATPTATSDIKD
ncbi:uncharacterized protein LTR77_004387 [Saxophila tyrrhenica]|uniref:Uncharacterized protein n=1 Tax=Saxophila tyrrhenica TaxID=1690608 RepID=A0AAV9PDS2_9PEZI|nr:hypothetical protein LTR77_004387 [Saxophila tyrrhenica]